MLNSKNLKFSKDQYRKLANIIRSLSADAVEKAKSGHPGMPLGMADFATVLFAEFLKFDPKSPDWNNRDRFILSAGHGSMLQYAIMYLTGYEEVTIEQIKNFRQLGSKTSGHPENDVLKGVETTTGPLGQGFANAVGMAIAEQIQAKGSPEIDHKTYVIMGDGCIMEGISHEAASLAGHLKLNKLIAIYDSNKISIDGSTDLTMSDDTKKRFESYNWNYIKINGHDFEEIHDALSQAQTSDRPVLIECCTKIGFGAPTKEDSEKSHGAPLGPEEVIGLKKNLGITNTEPFFVDPDLLAIWRNEIGNQKHAPVKTKLTPHATGQKLLKELKKAAFQTSKEATRVSSQKILEKLQENNPFIISGSADLSGSNGVWHKNIKAINRDNLSGNFIHYGVRENAMAGICNGIALYNPNFKAIASTFLVFLDYMKPGVRLSAIMNLPVTYIFTHDSIGVGEDGPTHQPIEQLASLRSTPNLICMRPADSVETAECWEIITTEIKNKPSVLCLTRQSVPRVRSSYTDENMSSKGAYIISDTDMSLDVTIFATGSEVQIALEAKEILEKQNIGTRVISVPSFELFDMQSKEYKMNLICNSSLKVAVEAASRFGWDKYIGPHGLFIGMDNFGLSAPGDELYKYFGITAENIVNKITEKRNDS